MGRSRSMGNGPFSVDNENSLGFLLWQTTISWHRRIKKALESYGISHAQFVILAIILWLREQKHASTQGVLIEMSKLDKMTVSKALRKLVTMGLIQRHESPVDARAKSVYLTESGVALALKLVPLVEGIDATFFGQLTQQEQSSLIIMLQRLSR